MLIDILYLFIDTAEFLVFRLKNWYGAERTPPYAASCSVGKICVMRWVNIFRLIKYGVILRERVYYVGIITVNDSRGAESACYGVNVGLAENFLWN